MIKKKTGFRPQSGSSSDADVTATIQRVTALISVGGVLLMILSPQTSLTSARKAVDLWLFTVLPSMLPFFICTDLLLRSGMHIRLGKIFERPFRWLFGVPGVAGFVYISSILSGYPAGARILGEMCSEKQISKGEAADILTFCSTSGPLFILGAVGSGMLQSQEAGYILLFSHYLGSLMTGVFLSRGSVLRRTRGYHTAGMLSSEHLRRENREKKDVSRSVPQMIAEAILSSFQSLFIIGGYIILFMILTDAVKNIMTEFTGISGFPGELIAGCLEMTVGCSGVASSEASAQWKIAGCAFLISFGGLSVAAQSMSVLKDSGVRLGFFLRFKLMHGLISALCACTMIKILSVYAGGAVSVFETAGVTEAAAVFSPFSGDLNSAYSAFYSSTAAAVAMIVFFAAVILFSGRGQNNESDGNHSGV